MAKKKSPVDAALEVARKVRVPKKPVKAKGKKTVPTHLDWGPGIPEDKLAYLNDEEMALVQAKRGFKGKRSVDGIPAFPDPGDTAAGGSKPTGGGGTGGSTGSSTGPDRGPTGGPSSGNGGLGGGGKGGAGGGGGGLGGGGQGGPSGGAGGTSSSGAGSGSGGSDKGQKTTSPSGGPSGGPTSAPARTEASRAVTTPSGYGPRVGNVPGNPVSTAPSTYAYESALDRIAQGSSIVGGYNAATKDQSRVPQEKPSVVNFSQTPTVAGPNRGLAGVSSYGLSVGANSPFADPSVESYTPATNRIGVDPNKYSAPVGPTQSMKLAADAMRNVFSGTPDQRIAADPNKYSAPVGPTQSMKLAADAMRNVFNGTTSSPAKPKDQERIVSINGEMYAVSPERISQQRPEVQAGLSNYLNSYSNPPVFSNESNLPNDSTVVRAQNYNFVSPSVPTSPTRDIPAAAPAPAVTANNSFVSNPYNKTPEERARDIRNAIAAATGRQPAATASSANINVPGYSPDVSPSQGDYPPSQQPPPDVSPSQQSGWTQEQRDAYLNSLIGSRQGPVPVVQDTTPPPTVVPTEQTQTAYLQPLPEWVDYSYLYNNYPETLSATPVITGFNQYNATMNRGGRIGNSIDAALRLARQSIVSRHKTR